MAINMMSSVKELALTIPGATRVFEELGIDYCCGGNKTLINACNNAKVPFAEVIESLSKASTGNDLKSNERDWSNASVTELIRFIVDTHHVFTRQELARLERLVDKVCRAHQQNHPELGELREQIQLLAIDLTPHMAKEEQALFPYIVEMEKAINRGLPLPLPFFVTVQNPVRVMTIEHNKAGDLLKQIRSITNNFTLPSDACTTFHTLYQALQELEVDLQHHIHLENNVLFPKAIVMENHQGIPTSTVNEFHCLKH